MTPDELVVHRDMLRWTWYDLEAVTGIPERHWRRMAAGERVVPPYHAAWLRALAGFHRDHPPPLAPERVRGKPAPRPKEGSRKA